MKGLAYTNNNYIKLITLNYETNRKKSDFTKTSLQKDTKHISKSDATVTVEHTKSLLTFVGIKDTFSQCICT